jgi:hypothetical protein
MNADLVHGGLHHVVEEHGPEVGDGGGQHDPMSLIRVVSCFKHKDSYRKSIKKEIPVSSKLCCRSESEIQFAFSFQIRNPN